MSIDLSKAKIGDKFLTKEGKVATLQHKGKRYTLIGRGCFMRLSQNGKLYEDDEESKFDLVEQVFDNGDQLDNNISVEEGGLVLAELTKREYEKAKKMGIAIQSVPYIVEQQKEDNLELQRRQQVVELAEKLVVNEEMMKSHKDLFEAEVHNCAKTLTTYTAFVIRSAEDFIKHKNQYLKDGKL